MYQRIRSQWHETIHVNDWTKITLYHHTTTAIFNRDGLVEVPVTPFWTASITVPGFMYKGQGRTKLEALTLAKREGQWLSIPSAAADASEEDKKARSEASLKAYDRYKAAWAKSHLKWGDLPADEQEAMSSTTSSQRGARGYQTTSTFWQPRGWSTSSKTSTVGPSANPAHG